MTEKNKAMKELTEILPKFSQYEDIEYAGDFLCPECENSGIASDCLRITKPDIVGWCDTPFGYMVVMQCPICYTKYRFHGSINSFDFEAFNTDLYIHFISRGDKELAWVNNADELYKKLFK